MPVVLAPPAVLVRRGSVAPLSYRNKEGWLVKRGHLVRSWRKRYFVLEGAKLSYYHGVGDTKPKGTISLKGASVAAGGVGGVGDGVGAGGTPGAYLFTVVQPPTVAGRGDGTAYVIEAASDLDRLAWMDAINFNIRLTTGGEGGSGATAGKGGGAGGGVPATPPSAVTGGIPTGGSLTPLTITPLAAVAATTASHSTASPTAAPSSPSAASVASNVRTGAGGGPHRPTASSFEVDVEGSLAFGASRPVAPLLPGTGMPTMPSLPEVHGTGAGKASTNGHVYGVDFESEWDALVGAMMRDGDGGVAVTPGSGDSTWRPGASGHALRRAPSLSRLMAPPPGGSMKPAAAPPSTGAGGPNSGPTVAGSHCAATGPADLPSSVRIFTATWNMAEMAPPVGMCRKLLPPHCDIYAISLQESMHTDAVFGAVRGFLGHDFVEVTHRIGGTMKGLGYHGHIALGVWVREWLVGSGMCKPSRAVRGQIPLGMNLVVTRAGNKGAVAIALPMRLPDADGALTVSSSLVFVACHLAADVKNTNNRVLDRIVNAREMLTALGLDLPPAAVAKAASQVQAAGIAVGGGGKPVPGRGVGVGVSTRGGDASTPILTPLPDLAASPLLHSSLLPPVSAVPNSIALSSRSRSHSLDGATTAAGAFPPAPALVPSLTSNPRGAGGGGGAGGAGEAVAGDGDDTCRPRHHSIAEEAPSTSGVTAITGRPRPTSVALAAFMPPALVTSSSPTSAHALPRVDGCGEGDKPDTLVQEVLGGEEEEEEEEAEEEEQVLHGQGQGAPGPPSDEAGGTSSLAPRAPACMTAGEVGATDAQDGLRHPLTATQSTDDGAIPVPIPTLTQVTANSPPPPPPPPPSGVPPRPPVRGPPMLRVDSGSLGDFADPLTGYVVPDTASKGKTAAPVTPRGGANRTPAPSDPPTAGRDRTGSFLPFGGGGAGGSGGGGGGGSGQATSSTASNNVGGAGITRLEGVHPTRSYVFVMGDVNFRVGMPFGSAMQHVVTCAQHVQRRLMVGGDLLAGRRSGTPAGDAEYAQAPWMRLLRYDQLRIVLRHGLAFPGFAEGPITFPPTYRVNRLPPRQPSTSAGSPYRTHRLTTLSRACAEYGGTVEDVVQGTTAGVGNGAGGGGVAPLPSPSVVAGSGPSAQPPASGAASGLGPAPGVGATTGAAASVSPSNLRMLRTPSYTDRILVRLPIMADIPVSADDYRRELMRRRQRRASRPHKATSDAMVAGAATTGGPGAGGGGVTTGTGVNGGPERTSRVATSVSMASLDDVALGLSSLLDGMSLRTTSHGGLGRLPSIAEGANDEVGRRYTFADPVDGGLYGKERTMTMVDGLPHALSPPATATFIPLPALRCVLYDAVQNLHGSDHYPVVGVWELPLELPVWEGDEDQAACMGGVEEASSHPRNTLLMRRFSRQSVQGLEPMYAVPVHVRSPTGSFAAPLHGLSGRASMDSRGLDSALADVVGGALSVMHGGDTAASDPPFPTYPPFPLPMPSSLHMLASLPPGALSGQVVAPGASAADLGVSDTVAAQLLQGRGSGVVLAGVVGEDDDVGSEGEEGTAQGGGGGTSSSPALRATAGGSVSFSDAESDGSEGEEGGGGGVGGGTPAPWHGPAGAALSIHAVGGGVAGLPSAKLPASPMTPGGGGGGGGGGGVFIVENGVAEPGAGRRRVSTLSTAQAINLPLLTVAGMGGGGDGMGRRPSTAVAPGSLHAANVRRPSAGMPRTSTWAPPPLPPSTGVASGDGGSGASRRSSAATLAPPMTTLPLPTPQHAPPPATSHPVNLALPLQPSVNLAAPGAVGHGPGKRRPIAPLRPISHPILLALPDPLQLWRDVRRVEAEEQLVLSLLPPLAPDDFGVSKVADPWSHQTEPSRLDTSGKGTPYPRWQRDDCPLVPPPGAPFPLPLHPHPSATRAASGGGSEPSRHAGEHGGQEGRRRRVNPDRAPIPPTGLVADLPRVLLQYGVVSPAGVGGRLVSVRRSLVASHPVPALPAATRAGTLPRAMRQGVSGGDDDNGDAIGLSQDGEEEEEDGAVHQPASPPSAQPPTAAPDPVTLPMTASASQPRESLEMNSEVDCGKVVLDGGSEAVAAPPVAATCPRPPPPAAMVSVSLLSHVPSRPMPEAKDGVAVVRPPPPPPPLAPRTGAHVARMVKRFSLPQTGRAEGGGGGDDTAMLIGLEELVVGETEAAAVTAATAVSINRDSAPHVVMDEARPPAALFVAAGTVTAAIAKFDRPASVATRASINIPLNRAVSLSDTQEVEAWGEEDGGSGGAPSRGALACAPSSGHRRRPHAARGNLHAMAGSVPAALTTAVAAEPGNPAAWLALLRHEAAVAVGDDAAMRALPARFSAAFAALGAGDVRKTKPYGDLQVEEARVMMQIDPAKARMLFKTAKASSIQRNNWDMWRLYIIHEARQGNEEAVERLVEGCKVQFKPLPAWQAMAAAVAGGRYADIAAMPLNEGALTTVDTSLAPPPVATPMPTPPSAPDGDDGMAMDCTDDADDSLLDLSVLVSFKPTSTASASRMVPPPATTAVPEGKGVTHSNSLGSSLSGGGGGGSTSAAGRASMVVGGGMATPAPSPSTAAMLSGLRRRRTTMVHATPFISSLSPVAEHTTPSTAVGGGEGAPSTSSASSVASSEGGNAAAAAAMAPGAGNGANDRRTKALGDTARIMAMLPTPSTSDFHTPATHASALTQSAVLNDSCPFSRVGAGSGGSDGGNASHLGSTLVSGGHTAVEALTFSTLHDTSTCAANTAAPGTAPSPTAPAPAGAKRKVAFEVPDYIKNFSVKGAGGAAGAGVGATKLALAPAAVPSKKAAPVTLAAPTATPSLASRSGMATATGTATGTGTGTAGVAATPAPVTTGKPAPAALMDHGGDTDDTDEDGMLISPIVSFKHRSTMPHAHAPPPPPSSTATAAPATHTTAPSGQATSPTVRFGRCDGGGQREDDIPTQYGAGGGGGGGGGGLDSSCDDSDLDLDVEPDVSFKAPCKPAVASTTMVRGAAPPAAPLAKPTLAPAKAGASNGGALHRSASGPAGRPGHSGGQGGDGHGDGSPVEVGVPTVPPAFAGLGEGREVVTISGRPYLKLDCIGKGGSSRVYRVLSPDMQVYALKRVRLSRMDPAAIANYTNEIALLKRLAGHRHIIRLLDSEVSYETKCIHLVMEYGQCDLNKLLQQERDRVAAAAGAAAPTACIDPVMLRLVWQQMLQAVQTIHDARIVHGDLKPANFVFVEGVLKLIDFGIAKAISNDTTNIVRDGQVGTINYMSPEALMDVSGSGGSVGRSGGGPVLKLGRASDIWSMGCILYQMAYGKTPFADLSLVQKLHAIVNDKYEIHFPDIHDVALVQVMKECLRRDASKRPPISGVGGLLEHPFLQPHKAVIMAAPAPAPWSAHDLAAIVAGAVAYFVGELTPAAAAQIQQYCDTVTDSMAAATASTQSTLTLGTAITAATAQLRGAKARALEPSLSTRAHAVGSGDAPANGQAMAMVAPPKPPTPLGPSSRGRGGSTLPSSSSTGAVRSTSQPPPPSAGLQEAILRQRAALKHVDGRGGEVAVDKENAAPNRPGSKMAGCSGKAGGGGEPGAASGGLEAALRRGLSERFARLRPTASVAPASPSAAGLDHSVLELDTSAVAAPRAGHGASSRMVGASR